MKTKIDPESRDLHEKFTRLGHERNQLTYQLLKLLPEINRLRVYEKYGYSNIITYAGIVAGLSEGVVKKTLNLDKHLEGKPLLKEAIATNGVHKVAIVASIATPETEKEWVNRLNGMNKADLQELAREVRDKERMSGLDLLGQADFPCQAIQPKFVIELDKETQFLFLKLKKKMGKEVSNKEALKRMLKALGQTKAAARTTKPQTPKQCKFLPGEKFDEAMKKLPNEQSKQANRHISKEKKQEAIEKYKDKCAYPGCTNPYYEIHHIDGFSKTGNHDNLILLCKTHHNFAHNGLIANIDQSPEKWELRINHSKLTEVDKLFKKYRQEAISLPSLDNNPRDQ